MGLSARAPSRLAALGAAMKPTFTLGIEEEYQTVDPETRDLRSHIHAEIIEKGRLILQERVKTEMHQSVVEVGTSVCHNIKEAREELKDLRRNMIRLSRENGLRLAAAATHPFADWRVQALTPGERYKHIVEDMQLVARANLIFGLHVHVGIEDRETLIQMMNHDKIAIAGSCAESSSKRSATGRFALASSADFSVNAATRSSTSGPTAREMISVTNSSGV